MTLQIPDTSKFYETTGWKPKHDFADSVKMLMDYWRKQIAMGKA